VGAGARALAPVPARGPLSGTPDSDAPLSILHVVDHVRNVGNGIVNVTVDLACAQAAAGHRVAVASAGGDYEPLLAADGVHHHRLEREDSLGGRTRLVARLQSILRVVRPEVVNAHRPYAGAAARLLRPLHGFALVATDHNEFDAKGRVVALADLVIAVSEGAATSLASTGVDPRRIRVVQNGPLFGARHTALGGAGEVSLEHPAVVTVAGLVKRKGVHVLFEAFELASTRGQEMNLYFVGEGRERTRLEELAARSRFGSRVHFAGFQPDPRRYLLAADAFVLASFRDPFPLAVLEARGADCAVVVSDVDGLPEAVDHGEAGIIVPAGDAGALADALSGLLGAPSELADLRRRAGAGLERFSVERMARDTVAVYREALARTRPRQSQR
jgi:glycosyltransferase involved in cell wall biosynthesis